MEPEIKELTSADNIQYKAFLLTGLIEDEEHFRIAPDDDIHSPFPTSGRNDSFTLGAFMGKELSGIVSFERDRTRAKLEHKGLLFRMYVPAIYRGRGVGYMLIAEVIKRAKELLFMEQINLTVVANNETAKRLYSKFGFEVYATEKKAIHWKGKYFDEDFMVLYF